MLGLQPLAPIIHSRQVLRMMRGIPNRHLNEPKLNPYQNRLHTRGDLQNVSMLYKTPLKRSPLLSFGYNALLPLIP